MAEPAQLPEAPSPAARRRCGTCYFYDPSPLRGKGWCRHPLLRGERELALVDQYDHRCIQMLHTDYWQPATVRTTGVPPEVHRVRRRHSMRVYGLIGLVVLSFGLIIAGYLAISGLAGSRGAQPAGPPYPATAKIDFWLRSDAAAGAERLAFVPMGARLELHDSKAGEILDQNLESPAKWYKVKVVATGQMGWAYVGWVERQP